MRFTEAEAKAKKRQWVRVRNDAFAAYGLQKDTRPSRRHLFPASREKRSGSVRQAWAGREQAGLSSSSCIAHGTRQ